MLRHLSRVLARAGTVASSNASSCCCSSSACITAASSTASASSTRYFATEASKSMLGSSSVSTTNVLESAAEARLQAIKAGMGAQAAHQEKSLPRKLLGYLGDLIMLGIVGTGGAAAYYYYRYDTAELEKVVEETRSAPPEKAFPGSSLWVAAMDYYVEFRKGAEKRIKDFTDPTYHKLLPDMAPELRGRIKTLVLDLDDLLIHKEWTRQKGWTIYKRPGVQDFVLEMGQYYELVVFTDEPNTYADPIINRLDTHRVIPYRLYRPETQYHNGKHVRDLSKLNRELSQVLFISANPDAYAFQPENTIKLKPWTNDPSDTTLLDLIPFLQMIAMRGVRDTREVVKSYDGEDDIPKAFKARMQYVSEHQKQHKSRGFLGGLSTH